MNVTTISLDLTSINDLYLSTMQRTLSFFAILFVEEESKHDKVFEERENEDMKR